MSYPLLIWEITPGHPVCQDAVHGGWTRSSGKTSVEVAILRELIRNLQGFQALRETYNITEITGPGGERYSIFDIEYLYECRSMLSVRQREAIELFLFHNIKEREVAQMMQVADTNPIAMYATQGLKRLCLMIESGKLPGYRGEVLEEAG